MEWNVILGIISVVIATHLFIHEAVLAVRGFINLFASGSQAIPNAQTSLNSLTATAQQILNLTQSLSNQATTTTATTAAQAVNNLASTALSGLQSLNNSLTSGTSNQVSVNSQQSALQQSLLQLNTNTQSLYTTISGTASLSALLPYISNIPGLTKTLLDTWNNTASSLVSTASALVGTQATLQAGDFATIIGGAFFFNETQFDQYFKSISANNSSKTQSAILVRWIGLIIFTVGICIMTDVISLNALLRRGA